MAGCSFNPQTAADATADVTFSVIVHRLYDANHAATFLETLFWEGRTDGNSCNTKNSHFTKIKDPDNTGISTSEVDEEINRAIRHYSNERFWFNEKQSDITLTSGSQVIPSIPSDTISVLKVNGIMLIDDQVKITLQHLLPDEFFRRDDDQTGRPYFYTYRNNEYIVLPTPNENYPIKDLGI